MARHRQLGSARQLTRPRRVSENLIRRGAVVAEAVGGALALLMILWSKRLTLKHVACSCEDHAGDEAVPDGET